MCLTIAVFEAVNSGDNGVYTCQAEAGGVKNVILAVFSLAGGCSFERHIKKRCHKIIVCQVIYVTCDIVLH